jgi:photosystem II stability/assembly factor-like uncharacterized protein
MSIVRRWSARAGGLIILLVCLWSSPVRADSGSIVWRRADGPWGGTVRALAIDPQKPHIVYAGTTCGVYQSNDSGRNWARVGDGEISCQDIRLLAIDPTDPKIIYAAGSSGLFRTNDRGSAWTRLDRDFTGRAVSALAVDPSLQGVLYVAVQGTIWKSVNYGGHWTAHDAAFRGDIVWTIAVDPSDSQRLYAGTHRGLYLSRDGGGNWELVGAAPQVSVRAIATALGESTRLYIATDQGLLQSLDNGATWQIIETEQSSPTTAILVHPTDDAILFAIQGSRKLLRSQDQGQSWSALLSLSASQSALAMAIDPYDPQRLYMGTTQGLYTSADEGQTWDTSIGGIAASEVRQVIDVPGTKGQLYVLTPGGIMETMDGGKTWQGRNHGLAETDVLALGVDPRDRRMVYAVTNSGDFWRSQDGGAQWALTEEALPGDARANRLLVWHPTNAADPILYITTENEGVLRSLDHGQHWETLSKGLPPAPVRGMAFVYGRKGLIYVGAGPDVYRLAADTRSMVDPQWERVTAEPLNGQVTDLCVFSHQPQTLYASTEAGGIYRQRQENSPWESLSREILPFAVPAKALWVSNQPWQSPLLWAITDAGLFSSQDQGATWSLSNLDCLQQGNVRCLATDDRAAGELYVGTARSGLYYGRPTTAPIVSVVGYLVLAALAVGGLAGLIKGRDVLHRYWQSRSRLLLEQNAETWNAIIDETLRSHDLVTPDLLDRIPSDSRLIAMRGYVQTRQDRVLLYREQPPAIEPEKVGDLQTLALRWSSLLDQLGRPAEAIPIATQLTEQVCELLGFEPLESRAFRSLFGYLVQAPTLRLGIPSRFPIIFALRPELQAADIQDIRDLMNVLNVTSFFALLVIIDQTPEGKERVRTLASSANGSADDCIVLNYQDLRSLFLASDARRSLVNVILEQADLTLVSPYVLSGPVPDNMFFGRDYEIKAIMRTIRDRNHAILGGRKIGKTSVLTKIHRLLEQTSGFCAYYLDCEHIFDYQQFLASLALACQPPGMPKTIDDLRHLAICLRRQHGGKTIVFLFDEIDHLLAFDRQNQDRLFGVLRALSLEGLCRMIFCGERVLHRALGDPQHPLSAMANVIELGYLSQHDALRVIREPMAAMGVAFERVENLPQRIAALSSGHPNLVQAICHMLIGRVNERGDRVIWARDLSMVRNSDDYRDFVLEVVWGDASTVERLITVLMASKPTFTLEDVRLALQGQGYETSHANLEEMMDELVLLSVLRRRGGQYTFIAPSFTAIMSDSQLTGSFSEAFLEKLRDEEPRSFAAPLQTQSPQSRNDGVG